METRAHHLMIGSFAIGISVLTVLFLMWIGKFEFSRQYAVYMLRFEGSVSGLSKAADVLYNGIKVGEVTKLELDPQQPSHVLVYIQVERTAPVKTDSYASLETQGLTGVAAIQLAGGTKNAKAIVPKEGQDYPEIETRRSVFQQLFAGAPELINRGNAVLDRLTTFLNPGNQEKFGMTIQHVERLTNNLAKASDKFDSIASNLDKIIAGDAKGTLANVRGVADDIRQIMADARGPLKDFARRGLPELLLAISDARQMISSVDRAAQRLEASPSSLIFGDKAVEYKSGGSR
jgi:phospholipid/cholesterol/gamma-HCH transport system substrate-binding protein